MIPAFQAIGLGFCSALATLTGVYASQYIRGEKPFQSIRTIGGDDYVKLEPLSVPVIRNGSLQGYVVVRSVFTADELLAKQKRLPLELYATEAVFRTIYQEEKLNFESLAPLPFDQLAQQIADAANSRMGGKFISSVIIEGITYLDADEVRCQANQETKTGQ